MEVKTKFNLKDKVFFYKQDGTIGRGIISRICIELIDKSHNKDIYYETLIMYEISPEKGGLYSRIYKATFYNKYLSKYVNFMEEKNIFYKKEDLLEAL